MVDRVVTGAHYGLRSWLVQRVSGAVMAVYAAFVAGWVLLHWPVDYAKWATLFSGEVARSFTLLALLAVFAHAWVGVRDIVMDYVKPASVRFLIHVLVVLALILYAIWAAQILWGL